MKVIIANYRYFIAGGPERYMFNFMREARKMGVECIPFSVDYAKNVATPYSKYFITARGGRDNYLYGGIKATPKNIYRMLKGAIYNTEAERKLRKLIRDEKPDVVYILNQTNSLSPSIINAAKKEGVRVVHRISDFFMFCPKLDFLCGDEICESCMCGNYKKALEKRCVKNSRVATWVRVFAMKVHTLIKIYKKVDAYITTCEFTKNKLIEGGIQADKVYCVPTFTEVDGVKPDYTNENYVLYLGRLSEQKGIIYAVEAMKYLKHYNVKLKITGELDDSQYSKMLSELIRENKLENSVEFLGFMKGEALETTIKNSMCIINPAIWYENMPNTVIESYAYGKPVLASNIGSLAEIVEDGYTGLLFEPKSSEDIAKKIEYLLNKPEIIAEYGRNARMVCEKKYSAKTHMNKVIGILGNGDE
ncbi:MAG: glycosyltransferase [Lachnospira sp.]|nr:glycosyltransferase [Lachnospira sp.]